MSFMTKVLFPALPVMAEEAYGPQVPLAALVTQAVLELLLVGDGVADGLAEVGLGEGLGVVGLGDGFVGSGLGDDMVGSGLGDDERLGFGVGETEVGGSLGVGDDVLAGCEWVGFPKVGPDVVWRVTGPQPASTAVVAHTAIAGQICFFFTSKLLTCWRTKLGHTPVPSD
jgi:hypothetical protein